jgi:hypothetical protein
MMSHLSELEQEDLLATLEERFQENINRHHGMEWAKVEAKLLANPQKLWSLNEMEKTGGEPDVIGYDEANDQYLFCDCSPESPHGRRSTCYDGKALQSRKANKPDHNAMDMALEMGIEMLDEAQYRNLQTFGEFDTKTSSWLKTPADIRALKGAIFADYRYGHVFVYHNGAESYYASRGFRGLLRV